MDSTILERFWVPNFFSYLEEWSHCLCYPSSTWLFRLLWPGDQWERLATSTWISMHRTWRLLCSWQRRVKLLKDDTTTEDHQNQVCNILSSQKNSSKICMIFSTSDISYQMCYCCRKLDFETFSGKFVRPCEAVGGRAPLIGLEICLSQSGVPGLTRPHKFGLTRPHTASHRLGLTQFVMWSVWANQKRAWPHRSASHGLTDLRVRDLRGRVRERPWEADLWGHGSPIGL